MAAATVRSVTSQAVLLLKLRRRRSWSRHQQIIRLIISGNNKENRFVSYRVAGHRTPWQFSWRTVTLGLVTTSLSELYRCQVINCSLTPRLIDRQFLFSSVSLANYCINNEWQLFHHVLRVKIIAVCKYSIPTLRYVQFPCFCWKMKFLKSSLRSPKTTITVTVILGINLCDNAQSAYKHLKYTYKWRENTN